MPTLTQFRDAYFLWIGLIIVFFFLGLTSSSLFDIVLNASLFFITFHLLNKSLNVFFSKRIKLNICFLLSFLLLHHSTILWFSHRNISKSLTLIEGEKSSFFFLIREANLSHRKNFWKIEGWLYPIESSLDRFWVSYTISSDKILKIATSTGKWKLTGEFYRSFLDQIRVKPSTLTLHSEPTFSNIFFAKWSIFRCLCMQIIEKHLQKVCPNPTTSHLIQTFLFGRPPYQSMKRLFASAGLSHLLVVSGLHFSCVIQSFDILFRLISYLPLRFFFQFIFYIFYFFLIGPRPPAFRAFLAAILSSLAKTLNHRPNEFQIYGLVLSCSAILDPCSVLTLSYQFSYLAVGSLLFFRTFFQNSSLPSSSLSQRVLHQIEEKITQNFTILLTLLPLHLSFWSTIPLLAPIMGLLLNEPMSWFIQLSGVSVLSSFIIPFFISKYLFLFLDCCLYVMVEMLWRAELNLWQVDAPIFFCKALPIFAKCFFALFLMTVGKEPK